MAPSSVYFDYATAGMFIVLGALFVLANVAILNRILRPTVPEDEKYETYECGEPTVGSAWIRFDMRFYTVALVFLIFDVEVAFLYPWGVVFRNLMQADGGSFVFLEALVFLVIVGVGLVYVWAKGDLDWVKSTSGQLPRVAEPTSRPAGSPGGPAVEPGEES